MANYENLNSTAVQQFENMAAESGTPVQMLLMRVNHNPILAKQFNDFFAMPRNTGTKAFKYDKYTDGAFFSPKDNVIYFSPSYLVYETLVHELGHAMYPLRVTEPMHYPTPEAYARAKCEEEAKAVINEYRVLKWDIDHPIPNLVVSDSIKDRFHQDERFEIISKVLNGKDIDKASPAEMESMTQQIADLYQQGTYRNFNPKTGQVENGMALHPSLFAGKAHELSYYEYAVLEALDKRADVGNSLKAMMGLSRDADLIDVVQDKAIHAAIRQTIQHGLHGSIQHQPAAVDASQMAQLQQVGAILLGGNGADTLTGTRGDDMLVSGLDNQRDVLRGGRGHDAYAVREGDVIDDVDGKGTSYYIGQKLTGNVSPVADKPYVYQDKNGRFFYERQEADLLVYSDERSKANGAALTIKHFQNGQFGINLLPSHNPQQERTVRQPENDQTLFQKQFDALPAKTQKLFKECEQKLIAYCKTHDYDVSHPKEFTNIAMALTANMRAERMSRVESLRIDVDENWKVTAFSHEPNLRMASVLANNVVQIPARESMDRIQQVEQDWQQQEEMQRRMSRGNDGPRLS